MAQDLNDIVLEVIQQCSSRPAYLDGLLQWASNPTSKSAGYGIAENLDYIVSNLTLRYGKEEAARIVDFMKADTELMVQAARGDIYMVRGELGGALGTLPVLEEHFSKLANAMNDGERRIFGAILKVDLRNRSGLASFPNGKLVDSYLGQGLVAILKSVDDHYPIDELESFLIRYGFLNKLLWIKAKGERSLVFMIPPYVESVRTKFVIKGTEGTSQSAELLAGLLSKGAYDHLCILDEIIQCGGLECEKEHTKSLPTWKGIIGRFGSCIAINPYELDQLRRQLLVIKRDLRRNAESILNEAMAVLKKRYWPATEFSRVDAEDTYWKVEPGFGKPVLCVCATPWLTPTIVQSAGPTGELVAIVTAQTFSAAEQFISSWQARQQVLLVALSRDRTELKRIGDVSPFADEIIKELDRLRNRQEQ